MTTLDRLPVKRNFLMDEYQKEVIEAPFGVYVVDAIAGAGKTSCLTNRIANMIDHGVNPQEITMVTFTRKAAKEMKERVAKVLDVQEEELLVNNGTFHSLANRFLSLYYRHQGRKLKLITAAEEKEMLEAEIFRYIRNQFPEYTEEWTKEKEKLWLKSHSYKNVMKCITWAMLKASRNKPEEGYLDKLTGQLFAPVCSTIGRQDDLFYINFSKIASELSGATMQTKVSGPTLAMFAKAFFEKKRRLDLHNFDDLLIRFFDLLLTEDDFKDYCRDYTHYLLVDEYQDVNVIQYEIVKALTHDNLLCIGDKAQAIYAFRGAVSDYIENFETYFQEFNPVRLKLKKNYRSGAAILARAQDVIRNSYSDMELIPTQGEGVVFVNTEKDMREEARIVVADIQKKLAAGVSPKDIAILGRGKKVFPHLEVFLREHELEYKVHGAQSFFENTHVRQAITFFKACYYRTPIFIKMALHSFYGIGDKFSQQIYEALEDGQTLLEIANSSNRKAVKLACKTLHEMMENAKKVLELEDFLVRSEKDDADELIAALEARASSEGNEIQVYFDIMIEKIKDKTEEFILLEADARRGDALTYIYDMWERYYSEFLEKSLTSDAGVLNQGEYDYIIRQYMEPLGILVSRANNMQNFLEEVDLDGIDEEEEEEDEKDRISIMTIHSAKGLEWEYVYTIGWNRYVFPTQWVKGETEEEKQERNLAYVCITRARESFYVSSGRRSLNRNSKNAKPIEKSVFLREANLDKFGTPYREEK